MLQAHSKPGATAANRQERDLNEPISNYLQDWLRRDGLDEPAVEGACWLDEVGLLTDDVTRPGRPLQGLLRDGLVRGGEQRPATPHGRWFITRENS